MARRTLTVRDILDATSFHAARVLLAAASLGVFDALTGRRATPGAVARRIGADPEATERLLRALVELHLLEREGRRIRLAPGARELLSEGGEFSLADLLRHRAARFKAWAQLEDSVRTGKPVVVAGDGADDPLALQAARARRDTARRWAPVLGSWVDLGTAKSMLLLGDGPAVYALHFARSRANLAITVVDTPAAVAVGKEYLRGKPEAGRIALVAGDFLRDAPPRARFGAAFLSDALHAHSPENVRRLLKKVKGALRTGGRLVVRDRFLDYRGPGPLENYLYDLQLLLTSREGRCHPLKDVEAAVRAAGFRRVSVADPGLADPARILTARA